MGQDTSALFSMFNFSPDTTTITDTSTIIGSNIEEGDGPIERHVLQEVGSYGYQLNRIIDVLWILLERAMANDGLLADLKPDDDVDRSHLPAGDEARKSVQDFYELAENAAKESEQYKRQAAELAARGLIKRIQRLRTSENASDNAIYLSVKAILESGLRE